MAFTKKGDILIPELLMEHLPGAFAGMSVMGKTGAAVINTSMPAGKSKVGDTIKVPYFDSIGELDDITTDGDALTPRALADSDESATVRHSGIAIEATKWAQWSANADPYAEGARQMAVAVARRADKALIEVAEASGGSVLTNDVWNATPVNLTYNVFVDSLAKFDDEMENIAALVVRSEVYASLLKLLDGENRPLLVPNPNAGGLSSFLGVPVFVSNRLTKDLSSPSHPKYTSLLMKKGALVFWMDGAARVLSDSDILADTDVAAMHIYWAAHRYKRLAGSTLNGVCRIIHNAE